MSADLRKLGPKIPTRELLPQMWKLIRDYRWQCWLAIALLIVSMGCGMWVPLLMGETVNIAIAPEKDSAELIRTCLTVLALYLLISVVDRYQAYLIQRTGQKVTHRIRCLIYNKIQGLSVPYFDQNAIGRLQSRIINDVKALNEVFTSSMSVLLLDSLMVVGSIIAMFWLSWELASWVLLTIPLLAVMINYFGKRLAIAYTDVRVRLAEINGFLGENVAAVAAIQRLTAEKERFETFEKLVDNHTEAQMRSVGLFAVALPSSNIIHGIAVGSLLLVGGRWVIEDRVSVGLIVAFFAYIRHLFQPIRNLIQKYNLYLSSRVAAERVVNILNLKSEVDLEQAVWKNEPLEDSSFAFEGVSFKYPTKNENALTNVSFQVPTGSSLALVGATGSGKSSIVRLIMRFYEPHEGVIRFGGRPITEWNRFELRSQIGVIHQDIYLLEGTLRDNLLLGRLGLSDELLEQQCRRVHLWDMVENRGGLEMKIREGGGNLSLGEKQLISFARVLAFDPPVMVMDEATASLDRDLEKHILAALDTVLKGRTSIVIAHRISTVQHCDLVVVLENGRVIERGIPQELITTGGKFAELSQLQE